MEITETFKHPMTLKRIKNPILTTEKSARKPNIQKYPILAMEKSARKPNI